MGTKMSHSPGLFHKASGSSESLLFIKIFIKSFLALSSSPLWAAWSEFSKEILPYFQEEVPEKISDDEEENLKDYLHIQFIPLVTTHKDEAILPCAHDGAEEVISPDEITHLSESIDIKEVMDPDLFFIQSSEEICLNEGLSEEPEACTASTTHCFSPEISEQYDINNETNPAVIVECQKQKYRLEPDNEAVDIELDDTVSSGALPECPICLEVCLAPSTIVSTDDGGKSELCGHYHCESCLKQFAESKGKPQCSECRAEGSIVKCSDKERSILNRSVHCIHKDKGCSITVPLRNLLQHSKNCQCRNLIECPGCTKWLTKGDAPGHFKACFSDVSQECPLAKTYWAQYQTIKALECTVSEMRKRMCEMRKTMRKMQVQLPASVSSMVSAERFTESETGVISFPQSSLQLRPFRLFGVYRDVEADGENTINTIYLKIDLSSYICISNCSENLLINVNGGVSITHLLFAFGPRSGLHSKIMLKTENYGSDDIHLMIGITNQDGLELKNMRFPGASDGSPNVIYFYSEAFDKSVFSILTSLGCGTCFVKIKVVAVDWNAR